MKMRWSIFVLSVMLTPMIGMAADVGSIVIHDTGLSQQQEVIEVAFSIKNISASIQEVPYGIRLQAIASSGVYETLAGEAVLKPGEESIQYATMTLPRGAQGQHDAFVLSRDEGGLVSVLKYAGVVDLVPTSTSQEAVLSDCGVNVGAITCKVALVDIGDVVVNYALYKGSMYGRIITEGVVTGVALENGQITIPLSDALPSGDATYRLWLTDRALAQSVVVHTEGSQVAQVQDEIAAPRDIIADTIAPSYIHVIILTLPGLLLLLLLYLALRRPKTLLILLAVSSITVGSVALAAIVLTDTQPFDHIFNGLSKDSGNQQFAITLDATEFQVIDSIGFSLVFQNTALPNAKPTGGSIDINIDGGSWSTLVASSDSGSIYHKTIAAISTAGTHTLNFRSPDLCGGAFGGSLFNFGIFGTTECLFSMPVTVVQNDPPTTPFIGGNCILGEVCNVGIVSTDTDGGQLCYEAQWPSGAEQSAGCTTEGTPVSVAYTFNSCSAAGTTVRAKATDTGSLQSAWGTGALNISGTITCTEPCSHCTYNGVNGDIGISAVPALLPPSGQVNIAWNLTNVATCSVVGNIIETGAQVDAWDWEVVRLSNSRQSSVLSGATKYVLSCTDLDGEQQTAEVVVSTVPNWQEF